MHRAIGNTALRAARRLLGRFIGRVFIRDFVEIFGTQFRLPFLRESLCGVDELEHVFFCHAAA